MLPADQQARLAELDDTRHRSANIAYAAIGVSAATIAVGFTMVLLNQPRLVGTTVQPQVGSDHASLSLVGVW